MKKLPKKELRVHKVYWLKPLLNKEFKKVCKSQMYKESQVVEELIISFLKSSLSKEWNGEHFW